MHCASSRSLAESCCAGYGNHATLANNWQESLVRLAFTPCLQ